MYAVIEGKDIDVTSPVYRFVDVDLADVDDEDIAGTERDAIYVAERDNDGFVAIGHRWLDAQVVRVTLAQRR